VNMRVLGSINGLSGFTGMGHFGAFLKWIK
jgi:hypothetical protein